MIQNTGAHERQIARAATIVIAGLSLASKYQGLKYKY